MDLLKPMDMGAIVEALDSIREDLIRLERDGRQLRHSEILPRITLLRNRVEHSRCVAGTQVRAVLGSIERTGINITLPPGYWITIQGPESE